MTTAIKACTLRSSSCAISTYIRAAFFHSTPFLDRKRRTFWGSGGGGASKKSSKSWQGDDDYSEPSSSKSSSWFKRQNWTNGTKRNSSGSQGPRWETFRSSGGVFHFCNEDDEEVETIFRAAFGGARFTYSDFFTEDHWRNSAGYSNKHRSSWNWKSRLEDEYDSYEQFNDSSDSYDSDLASNRLALGLSASGPLKLEDVKSAYRACALKWHPDRHQGSSKAVAEEKFKLCSAAYQSLCEKLD